MSPWAAWNARSVGRPGGSGSSDPSVKNPAMRPGPHRSPPGRRRSAGANRGATASPDRARPASPRSGRTTGCRSRADPTRACGQSTTLTAGLGQEQVVGAEVLVQEGRPMRGRGHLRLQRDQDLDMPTGPGIQPIGAGSGDRVGPSPLGVGHTSPAWPSHADRSVTASVGRPAPPARHDPVQVVRAPRHGRLTTVDGLEGEQTQPSGPWSMDQRRGGTGLRGIAATTLASRRCRSGAWALAAGMDGLDEEPADHRQGQAGRYPRREPTRLAVGVTTGEPNRSSTAARRSAGRVRTAAAPGRGRRGGSVAGRRHAAHPSSPGPRRRAGPLCRHACHRGRTRPHPSAG